MAIVVVTPPVKRTRIVAVGGIARDVKILDAAGNPIDWGGTGVSKVTIDPIDPDGIIRATLTLEFVDLG